MVKQNGAPMSVYIHIHICYLQPHEIANTAWGLLKTSRHLEWTEDRSEEKKTLPHWTRKRIIRRWAFQRKLRVCQKANPMPQRVRQRGIPLPRYQNTRGSAANRKQNSKASAQMFLAGSTFFSKGDATKVCKIRCSCYRLLKDLGNSIQSKIINYQTLEWNQSELFITKSTPFCFCSVYSTVNNIVTKLITTCLRGAGLRSLAKGTEKTAKNGRKIWGGVWRSDGRLSGVLSPLCAHQHESL